MENYKVSLEMFIARRVRSSFTVQTLEKDLLQGNKRGLKHKAQQPTENIRQPSGTEGSGPGDEKVTQVCTVRQPAEDAEQVNIEQPQDGLAGTEDETDGEQEHQRGVEYTAEWESQCYPDGRCLEKGCVYEVSDRERTRHGKYTKQPQ
uniref:Uncharacterized protein n=1 Tax=Anopheles farauti TaxID=69004 RepID=A0A182QWM7_9DIPT